jgi:hypothetical protein
VKRLAFALLLACSAPKPAPSTPSPGLTVTLEAHDATVAWTIENRRTTEATLPAQVLESASLLLEVRDVRGAVVPQGPPPTPDDRTKSLAPGAKLSGSVRVELPPGKYTLRARIPDATSNTADVVLP